MCAWEHCVVLLVVVVFACSEHEDVDLREAAEGDRSKFVEGVPAGEPLWHTKDGGHGTRFRSPATVPCTYDRERFRSLTGLSWHGDLSNLFAPARRRRLCDPPQHRPLGWLRTASRCLFLQLVVVVSGGSQHDDVDLSERAAGDRSLPLLMVTLSISTNQSWRTTATRCLRHSGECLSMGVGHRLAFRVLNGLVDGPTFSRSTRLMLHRLVCNKSHQLRADVPKSSSSGTVRWWEPVC